MAFIDIEDPVKREETVQDYIRNIQEIRQRKENQKVHGITEQQNIEKAFQPVVQATEKSARQITNEIKNLKETAEKKEKETAEKKEPKEAVPQALYYYFNQFEKSKLDQYYGIYERDGVYMMGEKEIKVDGYNNILIDNTIIKGSPGLWRLIMMKTPKAYTSEEERDYKELVERTNVIEFPHIIHSSNRPGNTAKKRFLSKIFGEGSENNESEKEEDSEEETEEEKDGTGISFLPGDINGLIKQLHLLLAEFRAGNKSATKTQIVAILDELLRRSYLNQNEYNGVCRALLC